MENLELYEKVRSVPETAKKKISGGRLNGMTDINPMWRIKVLTENFGMAGFGWYYEEDNSWTVEGSDGEVAAFVTINLYVKVDGEWSKPIRGTGGAKFIAKERSGYYTDDEAFKKATTDAISVACKALGIGADVYWQKDTTKYSPVSQESKDEPSITCDRCGKVVTGTQGGNGKMPMTADQIISFGKANFHGCYCANCQRDMRMRANRRKLEEAEQVANG